MTMQKKIIGHEILMTREAFRGQSVLAQYISVNCRPDGGTTVQLIASENANVGNTQFKSLKKTMDRPKKTSDVGFRFINLDIDSAKVVVLSDASFANAPGSKRQVGPAVLMVDDRNHVDVVHYGSSRCRKVSRSVVGVEVYALVHAFDHAYMVHKTLEELLGRQVTLEAFASSRTLFNVIAKDSETVEQRLQIDVCAL